MESDYQTQPSQESYKTSPAPAEAEEMNRRLWIGFGKFIDQINPWLNEVGLILFGSLIALNLLIQASLFTIGPVDLAVKIATAAFAFALPLKVTGLLLLRLIREFKNVKFEDRLAQAFQEAGFVSDQIPTVPSFEEIRKGRARNVVRLSLVILVLSILLVLIGLIATLWHMAWWIAVGFCVMVVICFFITIVAIANSALPNQTNMNQ
jgi:hypothetical protein